jgi:hypothetical protein
LGVETVLRLRLCGINLHFPYIFMVCVFNWPFSYGI